MVNKYFKPGVKGILLFAALFFYIAGSYAMTQVSVDNHVETGVVDIVLKEYQMSSGKKVIYEDPKKSLLPGDKVSKIPEITNIGVPCYVRASISILDEYGSISVDDIYGISDCWIKAKDGYWYYKEILDTSKSVDIFQGFTVPYDLPQEIYEGKTFQIRIDVDAIQSANFSPDYTKDHPWGTTKILICKENGEYSINENVQGTESLSVLYDGNTKKLIKNKEDFFVNIPVVMPGDTYSDTAHFYNNEKNAVSIFFRTEDIDKNNSELLDKITLEIRSEISGKSDLVYKGNLRALNASENQLLGSLRPGEDGKFTFIIYVPEELDNDYTLLSTVCRWIFSTKEITKTFPVQTDDVRVLFCIAAFSAGVMNLIIVFMIKRKEKENEDNFSLHS